MALELAVSVGAALTSLGVTYLRLCQCATCLAAEYGHRNNLTSPNALSGAAGLRAFGPGAPFLRHHAIHRAGVSVAVTTSTNRTALGSTILRFAQHVARAMVRDLAVGIIGTGLRAS